MVSTRSYTPWIKKASLPENDFSNFPTGVTLLGTVLPGKSDVKKHSVQLVPFHILWYQVPTPLSRPTFNLHLLFHADVSRSPSFTLYVIHQTQLQMGSGTLKFIPTCPDSGSRCRSQFCICLCYLTQSFLCNKAN